MEQSIMMWGTIVIFNLAILQLLRVTLAQADFREAMSEKAPAKSAGPPAADMVPADGAAIVVSQVSPPETSYSRVAGMIGAVVLACFVWAVGNVILYKVFMAQPKDVTDLVGSLGTYFLAAASLFAPYAVNQLGSAFRTR